MKKLLSAAALAFVIGFPALAAPPPPTNAPYVVIPQTSEAPPLSGNPAGGTWENAAWVGNPVFINEQNLSKILKFETGLLWDSEALYVGFRVHGFRPPIEVTTTKGDDGLERDDAVEVCFKVPGFAKANGEPVQFKLNCKGKRDDAINFDFRWNGDWEGKVDQQGHDWTATFKIPFRSFDVHPQPGDRWQANFAAFLVGYEYKGFLWSPVSSPFQHHHQGNFGTMEFGDKSVPGSAIGGINQTMSEIEVEGALNSTGMVRAIVGSSQSAKDSPPTNGAVITNFDSLGLGTGAAAQTSEKIEKTGKWKVHVEGAPTGQDLLKIALFDAHGKLINYDLKPITVTRSVELTAKRYPVSGAAGIHAVVYNLGRKNVTKGAISLRLLDSKSKVIATKAGQITQMLPYAIDWLAPNLKNGETYRAVCDVTPEGSSQNITQSVTFVLPPRPEWAGPSRGAP